MPACCNPLLLLPDLDNPVDQPLGLLRRRLAYGQQGFAIVEPNYAIARDEPVVAIYFLFSRCIGLNDQIAGVSELGTGVGVRD